jgi:hypothetical protein
LGWLGGASIAGRLMLGLVAGVTIASALSRLAEMRSRNAAPIPIRYIAPSRWSVSVPIADLPSISRVTMRWPFDKAVRWGMES